MHVRIPNVHKMHDGVRILLSAPSLVLAAILAVATLAPAALALLSLERIFFKAIAPPWTALASPHTPEDWAAIATSVCGGFAVVLLGAFATAAHFWSTSLPVEQNDNHNNVAFAAAGPTSLPVVPGIGVRRHRSRTFGRHTFTTSIFRKIVLKFAMKRLHRHNRSAFTPLDISGGDAPILIPAARVIPLLALSFELAGIAFLLLTTCGCVEPNPGMAITIVAAQTFATMWGPGVLTPLRHLLNLSPKMVLLASLLQVAGTFIIHLADETPSLETRCAACLFDNVSGAYCPKEFYEKCSINGSLMNDTACFVNNTLMNGTFCTTTMCYNLSATNLSTQNISDICTSCSATSSNSTQHYLVWAASRVINLSLVTPFVFVRDLLSHWNLYFLYKFFDAIVGIILFFAGRSGWANYAFPHILVLKFVYWVANWAGFVWLASFLGSLVDYLTSLTILVNGFIALVIVAYASYSAWSVFFTSTKIFSVHAMPPYWIQVIVWFIAVGKTVADYFVALWPWLLSSIAAFLAFLLGIITAIFGFIWNVLMSFILLCISTGDFAARLQTNIAKVQVSLGIKPHKIVTSSDLLTSSQRTRIKDLNDLAEAVLDKLAPSKENAAAGRLKKLRTSVMNEHVLVNDEDLARGWVQVVIETKSSNYEPATETWMLNCDDLQEGSTSNHIRALRCSEDGLSLSQEEAHITARMLAGCRITCKGTEVFSLLSPIEDNKGVNLIKDRRSKARETSAKLEEAARAQASAPASSRRSASQHSSASDNPDYLEKMDKRRRNEKSANTAAAAASSTSSAPSASASAAPSAPAAQTAEKGPAGKRSSTPSASNKLGGRAGGGRTAMGDYSANHCWAAAATAGITHIMAQFEAAVHASGRRFVRQSDGSCFARLIDPRNDYEWARRHGADALARLCGLAGKQADARDVFSDVLKRQPLGRLDDKTVIRFQDVFTVNHSRSAAGLVTLFWRSAFGPTDPLRDTDIAAHWFVATNDGADHWTVLDHDKSGPMSHQQLMARFPAYNKQSKLFHHSCAISFTVPHVPQVRFERPALSAFHARSQAEAKAARCIDVFVVYESESRQRLVDELTSFRHGAIQFLHEIMAILAVEDMLSWHTATQAAEFADFLTGATAAQRTCKRVVEQMQTQQRQRRLAEIEQQESRARASTSQTDEPQERQLMQAAGRFARCRAVAAAASRISAATTVTRPTAPSVSSSKERPPSVLAVTAISAPAASLTATTRKEKSTETATSKASSSSVPQTTPVAPAPKEPTPKPRSTSSASQTDTSPDETARPPAASTSTKISTAVQTASPTPTPAAKSSQVVPPQRPTVSNSAGPDVAPSAPPAPPLPTSTMRKQACNAGIDTTDTATLPIFYDFEDALAVSAKALSLALACTRVDLLLEEARKLTDPAFTLYHGTGCVRRLADKFCPGRFSVPKTANPGQLTFKVLQAMQDHPHRFGILNEEVQVYARDDYLAIDPLQRPRLIATFIGLEQDLQLASRWALVTRQPGLAPRLLDASTCKELREAEAADLEARFGQHVITAPDRKEETTTTTDSDTSDCSDNETPLQVVPPQRPTVSNSAGPDVAPSAPPAPPLPTSTMRKQACNAGIDTTDTATLPIFYDFEDALAVSAKALSLALACTRVDLLLEEARKLTDPAFTLYHGTGCVRRLADKFCPGRFSVPKTANPGQLTFKVLQAMQDHPHRFGILNEEVQVYARDDYLAIDPLQRPRLIATFIGLEQDLQLASRWALVTRQPGLAPRLLDASTCKELREAEAADLEARFGQHVITAPEQNEPSQVEETQGKEESTTAALSTRHVHFCEKEPIVFVGVMYTSEQKQQAGSGNEKQTPRLGIFECVARALQQVVLLATHMKDHQHYAATFIDATRPHPVNDVAKLLRDHLSNAV